MVETPQNLSDSVLKRQTHAGIDELPLTPDEVVRIQSINAASNLTQEEISILRRQTLAGVCGEPELTREERQIIVEINSRRR
jgi:hypothetical protein